MANKSQNKKFSIRIIGKALISLAIISLAASAIYILSRQINKINLTMAEKKEMDYLISNREAVNNKIKTDFMSVDSAYQEKINEAVPPVFNILPLVDAMESLAKKYSFTQTMSFSQPAEAPGTEGPLPLMMITFTMNIDNSNADNFISFLKDFEGLPYFASIDNISYLSSGEGGWKNNSTITLNGSLYAHK